MKLAVNIFLIAAFIVPVSATKPERTETQTVEDDGTIVTVLKFKSGRDRGNGNTIDDNHHSEHSDHCGDQNSSEAKSYQGTANGSFVDQCSNYGGVIHGGQCFVMPSQTYNWTDAWPACTKMGGQLAQVHAEAEWAAVTKYLQKTYLINPKAAVWIALYREPGAANLGSCIHPNASHWYTAQNQMHERLTAGNTWIRNRANCTFLAVPCTLICWGYTSIINWPCVNQRGILCQITNENQEFTLAPNKCVSEVVIEQGPGSCPNDCAKGCAKFGWCRSFNFRKNTSICEYFSWSINDNPKLITDENCQHFSYKFVSS